MGGVADARGSVAGPLDAWLADVRPMIEQTAGRTFAEQTPVREVSSDELARLLGASIERDILAARPGMLPVAARANAMSSAYAVASLTLGVYARQQRTVFIVPENIERMSASGEIPTGHGERMLRLTIAHELVHALQDQRAGLALRGAAARSADARSAFTAVVEGHAVWATRRLADRLGWAESESALLRLAFRGRTPRDDLGPKGGGEIGPMDPDLAYRAGATFIERQHEIGGNERVWEAILSPPVRADQIRNPDTYRTPDSRGSRGKPVGTDSQPTGDGQAQGRPRPPG